MPPIMSIVAIVKIDFLILLFIKMYFLELNVTGHINFEIANTNLSNSSNNG